MAEQTPVSWQDFKDVATRRLKEARHLVELKNHRYYDGAVTYALLSAECALKALILLDHGANNQNELPSNIRLKAFHSKQGHRLKELSGALSSNYQSQFQREEVLALNKLDQKDPYDYRYGAKRPHKEAAAPAIDMAQKVLDCMKRLFP